MKFERTDAYQQKLFEQALFDDKKVREDVVILITSHGGKLKAYCPETETFLQFPRNLRQYQGQKFIADIVEVINDSVSTKYYRAMKGSIREKNGDELSDEVVG